MKNLIIGLIVTGRGKLLFYIGDKNKKLVDENTKKDDLKNKFEQNIKYKNVDKFVDELVGLITVHYS